MAKYDRSSNTAPVFTLVQDISLWDTSLLTELVRPAFKLELGAQCQSFIQKNKTMQNSLILIVNLPDEAHYIGDVTCCWNLKE